LGAPSQAVSIFDENTPKPAQVSPAVLKRNGNVAPTSGRVEYAPERVDHILQALKPLEDIPLTPGHVDIPLHASKRDGHTPPTSGRVGYAPEHVEHVVQAPEPLEIVPLTQEHVDNAPHALKHVPQVQHASNSAYTSIYTTSTPLSTSQVDADAQECVMHDTQAQEPADDALDCVPHERDGSFSTHTLPPTYDHTLEPFQADDDTQERLEHVPQGSEHTQHAPSYARYVGHIPNCDGDVSMDEPVRGTPYASDARSSSASASDSRLPSASAPATSSLFRNAFGRMTSYATRSRPASAPDRVMSHDVARLIVPT